MDVLYERCCGLDIHKRTVVACLITPGPGGAPMKEVRSFGTMTDDLLRLADWLAANGVTHVAMESTGVYWKPVWNLLEEQFDAAAGQRAARQGGAGAQDRRQGLRVAGRPAAPRAAAGQLRAGPAPAGAARADAVSH